MTRHLSAESLSSPLPRAPADRVVARGRRRYFARRVAIVTFTTDFGFSRRLCWRHEGRRAVAGARGDAGRHHARHRRRRTSPAGAMALAQAAPLFPPGTIHVAVVDPGVGGARADVVVEAGGCFFVGPDNGVLSLAAPPPRAVHRIDAAGFPPRAGQPDLSRPRRVRADGGPAGGRAAGVGRRSRAAASWSSWTRRWCAGSATASRARVTHVDAFGNLLTSLAADAGPARRARRAAGPRGDVPTRRSATRSPTSRRARWSRTSAARAVWRLACATDRRPR